MRKLLLLITICSLILGSIISYDVAAQSIATDDILFDQMSTTIIVHSNGSVAMIIDARVNNIGSDSVTSV
ncbi:MAG: hypothetical protein ACW991_09025, partial [Candidatus Hodarchaeales archaeon]